MAERADEQWTNEGMGDRGGAARHRQEPATTEDERWPDGGFGDRGGAARRNVIEGTPDPNEDPPEHHGFWQSQPSDDPAGYGGGRERGEQFNQQSFGETGWGGSRGSGTEPPAQEGAPAKDLPKGAHPVPDSPNWDEKYARENADKYGQWGGKPIEQRGAPQSGGGYDHEEENVGDTKDISPRGAYGIRETEKRKE
jgi:hypothetical protein